MKKPARIKLSLSRPLSHSEQEYFREHLDGDFLTKEGARKTMVLVWEPHRKVYRGDFLDFKVRLSDNQQIYAETTSYGSRHLFRQVTKLLDDHFVNLHPTAVKTLRELG